MAGTKLGMTPIEYRVAPFWTAWIPLLDNGNYGLMMIFKPLHDKGKRSIVIREEFYSPEEAHEFAVEWYKSGKYEPAPTPDSRPKQIALMRAQGRTLQNIGDELGISRQRVFQIINGE